MLTVELGCVANAVSTSSYVETFHFLKCQERGYAYKKFYMQGQGNLQKPQTVGETAKALSSDPATFLQEFTKEKCLGKCESTACTRGRNQNPERGLKINK